VVYSLGIQSNLS